MIDKNYKNGSFPYAQAVARPLAITLEPEWLSPAAGLRIILSMLLCGAIVGVAGAAAIRHEMNVHRLIYIPALVQSVTAPNSATDLQSVSAFRSPADNNEETAEEYLIKHLYD